jgi:AmmeMemoRadiSam system protein B
MEMSKRKASHAGSWYSDIATTLQVELEEYLKKATKNEFSDDLKGIITPHAGYRWSGPTAAWAYLNINPDNYDRVVLLGPSHHSYIAGCGITKCSSFETPFGDIKVDTLECNNLLKMDDFFPLPKETDENEHSLEMQLPFLRIMFKDKDFSLIPIMVGQTTLDQDRYFAKLLVEYYKDPKTLFVISSDFCHWGNRFRFTYTDEKFSNIYEAIEDLDKKGIEQIEALSAEKFNNYLEEYKNTICGRRPISIFLATIEEYNKTASNSANKINFVRYDQSSKVKNTSESSVSYAVGLNILKIN